MSPCPLEPSLSRAEGPVVVLLAPSAQRGPTPAPACRPGGGGEGPRGRPGPKPILSPSPVSRKSPLPPSPAGGAGRRSMKESAPGSAGTQRDLDSVRPDAVRKDDPNLRAPRGMSRGRRAIDSHPGATEASQSAPDVKTAEPEGSTKTRGRSCKVSSSDSTATEMTRTAEAMEPKFVETPAPTTNRTRGRSRKVNDLNSTAAEVDQSTEILETPGVETPAPKENSRARGRSRKIGDSGSTTTEVEQTTDNVRTSSVETPAPKANSRARGRGRKISDSAIATTEAAQTAEAVGTGAKAEPSKSTGRDRGQKRALEVEGEEVSGSFKVPRGRSRRGGRGAGEQEERRYMRRRRTLNPVHLRVRREGLLRRGRRDSRRRMRKPRVFQSRKWKEASRPWP
ncbi:hypothetical protein ANANG_G00005940 [Anguilla anguilla]|uniref:Uncharacterized protein n=1 Tax=Anguilla anguilla TaxID=7936 RepID=A0A9D3MWI7_ANGAN|nr:hypothetical protein ANANG_G00005940 [Anguilla anguilla]